VVAPARSPTTSRPTRRSAMPADVRHDATDLIGQVEGDDQVLVLRFSPSVASRSDLVALAGALSAWGGIVERTPRALRVRCDLTVASGEPIRKGVGAVLVAIHQWASQRELLLGLESFALHSRREYDTTILRPEVPPLMGISEIAKRLKVSRQRASQLAREGRFGEPLTRLDATPVWSADTIDAVLAGTHGATKWRRAVGRPSSRPE
jgi:nucleotide-binding universal stress UspA family protein